MEEQFLLTQEKEDLLRLGGVDRSHVWKTYVLCAMILFLQAFLLFRFQLFCFLCIDGRVCSIYYLATNRNNNFISIQRL